MTPRGPTGAAPVRRLGPALVVATAVPIHVALALATELSPDEAYYLSAARVGAIPDHPPLLPALLAAADRLASLPVELRVRLVPIAASALLALWVARLVRASGGSPRAETIAALLATWLPLPAAGGFVATPDALALLAVAAALTLATRTASPHPARTLALASLVALGTLAKVSVLPVALLALAFSPAPLLRRAVCLAPSLALLPLAATSLRFQLAHAYRPTAWSPGGALAALVAFAAGTVALWSPAILLPAARRLRALPPPHLAVAGGVTALVAGSALVRAVPPEPNWWAPAAVPVLVAAPLALADAPARTRRTLLAVALLPTLVALTHAVRPWLPLPRHADPTARLHGWGTDDPPLDAPGTGPYAAAAEACARGQSCDEIRRYVDALNRRIASSASPSRNR